MASSNKKSRTAHNTCSSSKPKLDRISDLPGDVMDQILSQLWIEEAVKTSVLSKKWRYNYATVPNLVFHDSLVDEPPDETNKFVSLVDRVLLLHSGPVHKLMISVEVELPSDEIEMWILFAARRNLKVFAFSGDSVDTVFRLPSSLFSCQSLTNLELSECSLQLPSPFEGFKNLKSLRLDSVDGRDNDLERLISSSPLLETLTLNDCSYINYISLDAPNLQQLATEGCFFGLTLSNTPRLNVLSIDVTKYEVTNIDEIHFEHLFEEIPQIQRLVIGRRFLQLMTQYDDEPRDFEISFVNLHLLSIQVNFSEFNETVYLFGLLKCAPNLQELHIKCQNEEIPSSNSWEPDQYMYGPITSLRYLKFNDVDGSKAEMDFIRFMLLTLPALKRMTISLREDITEDQEALKVAKQLLLFSHASPNAKTVIL